MNLPTGVELHNNKIRISFYYRGTRCREVLRGWDVTSGNVKKAGNLRAAIVSEIQFGTFDYAMRFPESKAHKKFSSVQRIKSFKELADLFLASKALEVSAASLATTTSSINTLLRVVGDKTPIADIQHADLLNYRRELLTGDVTNVKFPWLNKKGRSASTVNILISLLCSMLRLANRSQFIKHAPYENIKQLKKSKPDPDPLLINEYHSMLDEMRPQHAILWTVAVHTGMRHGELCALAWEDIDLERGIIHVSRNLTAKGLFVPPKTDAGIRKITLLQPAIDALNEMHKITGGHGKREITFHHREHGKTEQQQFRFVFQPSSYSRTKKGHYSTNSIAYSWETAIKRARVRPRDPYQSRHTFACWSLSAGANPSFIASQMGHEDARMVYEVYSKWIGEMDADQVNMLNQKLPSAMSPLRPNNKTALRKIM
ncbi:MAG TPA: site-specific integrase [Scandinavium sp.]|jgi:integrase